ncbi:MAG: hypothetical protein ACD_45C00749G0003 [uncultured bacterium]|nr:MAG: hypothetical protein ACD_45C00749G0003 [uncultured bacterium]
MKKNLFFVICLVLLTSCSSNPTYRGGVCYYSSSYCYQTNQCNHRSPCKAKKCLQASPCIPCTPCDNYHECLDQVEKYCDDPSRRGSC